MGSPACFIVCCLCKDMCDATTAAHMWFFTDAAITPVRGYSCQPCFVARDGAGYDIEIVDRRNKGTGE